MNFVRKLDSIYAEAPIDITHTHKQQNSTRT